MRGTALYVLIPCALSVIVPLANDELAAQQQRRFAEVEWTMIGGIPPALDSPILRPLLLAASGGLFAVFDYGDHALKAFALEGTEAWQLGRSGGGPREFANPTDLQVDAAGRFWVLDPNNLRVTIVDRTGSMVAAIHTPRPFTRVIPLEENRFLGLDNTAVFAYLVAPDSGVIDTVPRPRELQEAEPLALEARVAPYADGNSGIVGFLYGGALVRVTVAGDIAAFQRGIEPIDLPRVVAWERAGALFRRLDPDAPYGALSVASQDGSVYVLFAGNEKKTPGGLVDVYQGDGLTYRYSLMLPKSCNRLAVPAPNTFVCLIPQPVPAVYVWRAR